MRGVDVTKAATAAAKGAEGTAGTESKAAAASGDAAGGSGSDKSETRTDFEKSADKLYGRADKIGGDADGIGSDNSDAKKKKTGDDTADDSGEKEPEGKDKKAEDSADEKDGDKTDDKKDEGESGKPPEKYDLQVPDDSLLDESAVERIAAEAKKHGLSQDDAQDLLQRTDRIAEEDRDARERVWRSQVTDDKELGGDNLSKTTTLAQAAIERFGSDELRATLEATGYGSHPAVIRFLRDIGRAMSEDKMVQAKGTSERKVDDRAIEDVIYSKNEP